MPYTPDERRQISEQARGKVVARLEWAEGGPLGGYWAMTVEDGSELSLRLMAEIVGPGARP